MAYGFGVVGCGMIARFHARAIEETRGAKLVACYDSFASAADRLADEEGIRGYHDLADMLADPDVDVVTICTPSGAHMEPAVAAARAGKHVVVEKPLEITLKRCDRIIAACKKNKVTLSTIFPSRFHESSVEMKRAIDDGRFGKLTVGDAYVKWYRSQEYYDSGAWRGTWELDGGGALMNQAIHSVDLLTWLMGPVREIRAQVATLAHKRIAVEDTAVATIEFANGALGVIEASTATYPGYLKRIEIHGSQGTAVMEEEDIKTWDFATKSRRDAVVRRKMQASRSTGGGASDPAAIGHHGHAAQFRDVLRAIKTRKRPAIDGVEGRRSVEIILAIYKAAETGRAVKLPLASDPVLKARRRRS
ncbi:MAG: gfo/Idh/MocA family oxidoreductase [Planctomycetota bacterium]|nr:MAG: gfo/Idh/MocA family oxidoreductase [Planctomycetota bacterium]REK47904.1 MAG: gfo/Idh/MocA family oxidoreductase [Planctomycetota bacterium]